MFTRETSDFWCTLHTGYSDEVRKLHSDNVPLEYTYKRVGTATSLSLPSGLAPDALRRTLHLAIPGSDIHPDKTRLWADYDTAKPGILGALYTVLSAILRRLPDAQRADLRVPWMSDFARRLYAADLEYGLGLYAAYTEHAEAIFEARSAEDPFIDLICGFLAAWGQKTGQAGKPAEFVGKAHDLLAELGKFSPESTTQRLWPADAARLSKRLGELTEPLRAAGVAYHPVDPNVPAARRHMTLRLLPEEPG